MNQIDLLLFLFVLNVILFVCQSISTFKMHLYVVYYILCFIPVIIFSLLILVNCNYRLYIYTAAFFIAHIPPWIKQNTTSVNCFSPEDQT